MYPVKLLFKGVGQFFWKPLALVRIPAGNLHAPDTGQEIRWRYFYTGYLHTPWHWSGYPLETCSWVPAYPWHWSGYPLETCSWVPAYPLTLVRIPAGDMQLGTWIPPDTGRDTRWRHAAGYLHTPDTGRDTRWRHAAGYLHTPDTGQDTRWRNAAGYLHTPDTGQDTRWRHAAGYLHTPDTGQDTRWRHAAGYLHTPDTGQDRNEDS